MNEDIFTVIGFWPDTGQKFMDCVYATSGDNAAQKITHQLPGLFVAGVIRGDHQAADTNEAYVY